MATKPTLSTLLTPPRPRIGVATGLRAPQDLLERAQSAYQRFAPSWLQDLLGNVETAGRVLGLDQPASAFGGPGGAMSAAALFAGAPGIVTKAAKAGELALDLAKLGKVVPMESFRSGWIKPDGALVQLSRDADTHSLSVAKALGVAPKQGTIALPKAAAEAGYVRAFAPGTRSIPSDPGALGAEIFSPPTDAQIRTMKQLERYHDTTLSYDIAHPETGTTMATGMGTNRIRGAIRDAELQHGGLWTGEEIPARGAEVTMPAKTYSEAAHEKPIDTHTGAGGNNIWIRQHNLPSNKSRTLMIQFSNRMINPRSGTPTTTEQYFDKLYNSRRGYVRPDDFWEIPQWQANLSHNMKDVDSYVVRDPAEAVKFLKSAGYGNVTASALDANRDMLHELASAVPTQKFSVGGYTDLAHFNDLPNVKTYDSMPAFLKDHGVQTYKDGYDYNLFAGTPTVPRLTMSTGCLHSCAFCSMPRKVVPNSEESIMQQAAAIGLDLPSKLIYLNDKTFGQAPNYKMLPDIYKKLKAANPDFDGFIIQTTAAQMKKLSPEFLQNAGIKQVELGLESYNDPILKAMHKPANQQLMDEAADKLRGAGIDLVPNLMVGLPGETAETYANTMNWLNKNSDIISHVNVNNLTIYRDAELANQLKPTTAADLDQNVVERSWHEDPAIHTGFYNDAAKFGSGQLDKVPFQNVTPKPEFQSAVATSGTRPTPVPSRGGTKALGLGLGVGTAALLASTGTPQTSAQAPQSAPRPPIQDIPQQRTKFNEFSFPTWYEDWANHNILPIPNYGGQPVHLQMLLNPPRPGGLQ